MTQEKPRQYAIMRTEKIKEWQALSGSGAHNLRLANVVNADPNRAEINRVIIAPEDNNVNTAVRQKIEQAGATVKYYGSGHKNNSVLAIEVYMGTSDDFEFKSDGDFNEWIDANIKFLEKKFGNENIVSAVVHMDETTPHIQAHIVPLTKDGRLSAKEFIGGHKSRQSKLQDEYFNVVKPFGLNRGLKGSKADHVSLKEYYKHVNEVTDEKVTMPKIEKPPLIGREEYQRNLKRRVGKLAKSAKYWKAECYRMMSQPDIRRHMKIREEKEKAEKENKLLRVALENESDAKDRIRQDYDEYCEEKKKDIELLVQKNEKLNDKFESSQKQNKLLSKKLQQYRSKPESSPAFG